MVYGSQKEAKVIDSPLPEASVGTYYVFASFPPSLPDYARVIAEALLILSSNACFKGTILEAITSPQPSKMGFKGCNSYRGQDDLTHGTTWSDSEKQAERARLGRMKLEEQKKEDPEAYKADRVKVGALLPPDYQMLSHRQCI
jgi:hypothetical protein